jgi:hypothetical protein
MSHLFSSRARDHGVGFFPDVVPQDDDPKIVSGNPCFLKSNEFRDRVIFTPSTFDPKFQ